MKYRSKFTKWDYAHMDVCKRYARLSSAKRLNVGAICVNDGRIISIGYNGMPSGWTNVCEVEVDGTSKTKKEVIHAEANCIAKLARSNESAEGSTMYVTHAPCVDCAKQIYGAGIKTVYFAETYRDTDGINFLKKSGIKVKQLRSKENE